MKLQDIKKKGFYWNPNNKKIIFEVYQNTLKSWLEERPQDDLIVDIWEYDYKDDNGNLIYGTDAVPLSREFCSDVEVKAITEYNCQVVGESGTTLIVKRRHSGA